MAVIENRSTLGDKFIKGLSAKVFDIKNQADQAYSLAINSALGVEANNFTRLFRQKSSDKARETITGKSGVGFSQLTLEGEDYKSDSRVSTFETQFNFQKLTNSVTVTEEDRSDRIADTKLSELRDLMIGMKMTMDRDAFNVLNNAFTAQTSLPTIQTFYGDSVPLASTLHPLKASTTANTTQSNASSTSVPLTEINFETGRQGLRRQTDDKDLPSNIGSGRLILLVPDSLEKTALRITKSQLRAETANNDLNIYRDGVVTVVSTKWINAQNGGSDTAWFLIDSMHSPLMFFSRQSMMTNTFVVDSNQNFVTTVKSRYQVGNDDFRGLWGSKGDSSAYSS